MNLVSKIELILEWGTLKKVELPSGLNGIKKEAEGSVRSYRNEALKIVIDSYRKKYPLLEKVIRGETTFEKEYKPLIDKYSGIKSFFIPSWLTDEEVKVPKENKGMIHDYNLSDRIKALEKPATWAVYLTTMAYAVSAVMGLFTETPKNIDIIMYAAAGFGFLVGAGFSEGTYKHKNLLKKDIKLLDKQIKEVYS